MCVRYEPPVFGYEAKKYIKKLPEFFRKPLNKIFILQSRRSLR